MQSDSVAARYAQALLDIGADTKQVEKLGKDLNGLAELYEQSSELQVVLTNPGIPLDQRQEVLGAILKRMRLQPMANNFMRLLVDRGRVGLLSGIAEAYRSLADEKEGRVRGRVVSATKLDPAQLRKLTGVVQKLIGSEVVLDPEIDDDLLGGLRVEIQGRVYDGTLRGQLQKIREQMQI